MFSPEDLEKKSLKELEKCFFDMFHLPVYLPGNWDKQLLIRGIIKKSVSQTSSSNSSTQMNTIAEYMKAGMTYVFEWTESKVLNITTETNMIRVILDKTIFHPQGGGQPADIGHITSLSNPDVKFDVSHVKKEGKVIYHEGQYSSEQKLQVGEQVRLHVDEPSRRLNARIHSAGHIADIALERIGISMIPTKGFHFPAGPYVEYKGAIPDDRKPNFIEDLQKSLDQLIDESRVMAPKFVPYDCIADECGGVCPSYMPKGEQARIMTLEGLPGIPCGGTHVENTKEIGKVTIEKFKRRKGIVRVRYKVHS